MENSQDRSFKRKFTKIPLAQIFRKKTKKLPNDSQISKIYKFKRSERKKLSSKIKNNILLRRSSVNPMRNSKDSVAQKNIETSKPGKRQSMDIKVKEDKLQGLIQDYLKEKSSWTTKSTPKRYEIKADFEYSNKETEENKTVEDAFEPIRDEEILAYQNDMEKNLKIEKIRAKNNQRKKLRLIID